MKLVFKGTDREPKAGDKLVDFRGDVSFYQGGAEPHFGGSTGRVYVADQPVADTRTHHVYFPGVFDLEWVDE